MSTADDGARGHLPDDPHRTSSLPDAAVTTPQAPATGPPPTSTLGPAVPAIAPARAEGMRAEAMQRLHGVPLGARMVAILCAVLLLGLAVTGVTAFTLLRSSLEAQVDDQLEGFAPRVVEIVTRRAAFRPGSGDLPSVFYIEVLAADGSTVGVLPVDPTSSAGTPRIPSITTSQVEGRDHEPFTVPATGGAAGWRTLVLPGTWDGEPVSVAVAVPLTGVHQTLTDMKTALVLIGLAVIALGSAAGWVAVRRSLRPLQEMEHTAAAIAAGDLTRRVPPAPPATEVGRLSAALNTMLGHIERAFEARAASEDRMRRFVADASHELRTPLATIRGYGELYRMGALTSREQVDDTVRRMEESATRMGRLVEDLLALARLDEGRPLRTDPVDLTVVAADALSDLRALDPTRPVRIAAVPAGADLGACVVVGDEDRLRQVLANLTGNVVQHTPPGTAVEVAVGHHSPGWALVEVRDHGPGIAPEHAARVFERFYRVDASRTRESGGAGLGMAIVAAIVEAHHGRVELAPTPGGGTTVRVWLPTRQPGADVDGRAQATAWGSPGSGPARDGDVDGGSPDAAWDPPARGAPRTEDAPDEVWVEPRG
jgi:two-component system OmpR family sensor kinase